MLPVSELILLVEQRVCGVEILDLPCLASGHNSDLTSEEIADLWSQCISINNYNKPALKDINVPGKIPLKQLEKENSWRPEGIIFSRLSNNLHNINANFKNYTREEEMNKTKLELFLILFSV